MDHSNAATLVVTSAIRPPADMPFLRLTDPQQRLFQTYCSLICWIRETQITTIILCDNTVPHHAFPGIAELADQYHKRLEVLTFVGHHDRTRSQGKGYGEGEIMKHVLEHSRFLPESTAFYKVTGRIFIENFDVLHDAHADQSIVFGLWPQLPPRKKGLLRIAGKSALLASWLPVLKKGSLPTTFYKCTRQYYKNNLIDRFRQVDDSNGYFLEHAMMHPLLKNGFDVFSTQPRFVGVSATKGTLYCGLDYSDDVRSLATLLLLTRDTKDAARKSQKNLCND